MLKIIGAITLVVVVMAAAGTYAVNAHQAAQPPVASGSDIMQVLKDDGRFKILLMALQDSGVDLQLKRAEPLTFFAPTDEAFQKVPKLADLLHDTQRLGEVLRGHIVVGERIAYAELPQRKTIVTYSGKVLDVKSDGRNINDARIEFPDVDAGSAVIHGIDKVLMENNDSKLRQAGEVLEDGVKKAGTTVYDGLKTGATKVKETFSGKSDSPTTSNEPAAK